MENKFYTDNFEQFLKESSDNFRMYPSKRVWHSIYNDLHPSRKWPSLAVCLLLISAIIFIGLSNKGLVSPSDKNSKINTVGKETPIRILIADNLNTNAGQNSNQKQPIQNFAGTTKGNPSNSGRTTISNENNDNPVNSRSGSLLVITEKAAKIKINTSAASTTIDSYDNDLATTVTTEIVVEPETLPAIIASKNTKNPQADDSEGELLIQKATEKEIAKTNKKQNISLDKEWIEDYAFHNKPSASKWKTKVKYQLYFTPSVGYRKLTKTSDYNPVFSSLVAPSNVNNQDSYKEALTQVAAVNMEIGGNILYSLAKNWNLKIGAQLNYTNYAINVYELKHPTTTTLLLLDEQTQVPTLESRSTSLANIVGASNKKLNNSTYQLSIPIGANMKIAGNNKLKWYAGATIQPTYNITGNAYLISSDLKNYVEDKSLMRKFNLNAGVETFISYQTKGGIIIDAGPQFRYQVLSSYSKRYTYDEKLYNIGLKIGITTKF